MFVFLSYMREDEQHVDRLALELRANGIDAWMDRDKIRGGQKWKDAISSAIRDAVYFIACFSNNYFKRDSTFMREELAIAVRELRTRPEGKAWFIPIRLTDCEIPSIDSTGNTSLTDFHWIDFYGDWDRALLQLLSALDKANAKLHKYEHFLLLRHREIKGTTTKNIVILKQSLVTSIGGRSPSDRTAAMIAGQLYAGRGGASVSKEDVVACGDQVATIATVQRYTSPVKLGIDPALIPDDWDVPVVSVGWKSF